MRVTLPHTPQKPDLGLELPMPFPGVGSVHTKAHCLIVSCCVATVYLSVNHPKKLSLPLLPLEGTGSHCLRPYK